LATEVEKQEAKVKVETIGASFNVIAAGQHKPSLAPKSRGRAVCLTVIILAAIALWDAFR
jgi:hypothetical protein